MRWVPAGGIRLRAGAIANYRDLMRSQLKNISEENSIQLLD